MEQAEPENNLETLNNEEGNAKSGNVKPAKYK